MTATYTVPGAGNTVHTITKATTFDREDLLITVTGPPNPTPVTWPPAVVAAGFPPTRTLSATFTCAYKASGTATLQIYASDQTLVRTVRLPFLTTDGLLKFFWDGTANPVNGQPGAMQPNGVYLFLWTITDSINDTDSDKSSYISLGNPASTFEKVSDDETSAGYTITYNLTSVYNRTGSNGQVDAYNPQTLQKATSQVLTGVGLTPGIHSVTMLTPSLGSVGDYSFLVSIQDNHADQDKGQRLRYTLQQNAAPVNQLAANVTASGTEYPGTYQVAGSIPLPTRTIVKLQSGMKFSGTYCGLISNAAFFGGLPGKWTYILSDKIDVNGQTVCEHDYAPDGVRSSSLAADFDSTHFLPFSSVFIRHTVTTTKGTIVYHFNDTADNFAYIIGNKHDLGVNAQLAVSQVSAIARLKMNHGKSASITDQKSAEIPVLLPQATAFYAYTHATQNAFADCFGEVTPVNPNHWVYANPQVNADTTPGNQTVQSLISLKAVPGQYLPPYWFVFLDGCSSAKSNTLSNEFHITGGADAAFLGWNDDVPNRIFYVQWTKQLWNNLAAGMTLQEAVHQDNLKLGKFLGPNTKGSYPRPIIFGDPMMKMHGLYGTKGTKIWFRPTM